MKITHEKIIDRAKKILDTFLENNPTKIKIDIIKLANFYGFDIKEKDLPVNQISTMNVSKDNKIKYIVVNEYYNVETKRYAIAYELAYYFLYFNNQINFHHEILSTINYDDSDINHLLASQLLIPNYSLNAITPFIRNNHTEIEFEDYISQELQVPKKVTKTKIKILTQEKGIRIS